MKPILTDPNLPLSEDTSNLLENPTQYNHHLSFVFKFYEWIQYIIQSNLLHGDEYDGLTKLPCILCNFFHMETKIKKACTYSEFQDKSY